MSENDNREFVRNIYAAIAEGDAGPLFAAMDDNFVTYEAESLPFGGEHRGLEANHRLVETLATYLDVSTLDMHHFLVDRDLVIALGSVVWRGVNGDQAVEMPLAEIWEFRGGKPISARPIYFDTATMLAPSVAKDSAV